MRSAALVAFLFLSNYALTRNFYLPFPSPGEMHLDSSQAVQGIAMLSFGVRRLGAELGFIRLMQYYGSAEPGRHSHANHECHHEHPAHEHRDHARPHAVGQEHKPVRYRVPREHVQKIGKGFKIDYGWGTYGGIYPRTLEILDLDPYFRYAALFSAGALAFNLGRSNEAVELLHYALKRDPHQWKYYSYLAAIGYNKAGNPEKVAEALGPVARDPDTPVLVKNVAAFFFKKVKKYDEAEAIYRDIFENTADPDYRGISERALKEISELRNQ